MNETIKAAMLIACMLFVTLSGWVSLSYFEAAAYRRVTGKQVTTWDAMFLDLRIQEPVK